VPSAEYERLDDTRRLLPLRRRTPHYALAV